VVQSGNFEVQGAQEGDKKRGGRLRRKYCVIGTQKNASEGEGGNTVKREGLSLKEVWEMGGTFSIQPKEKEKRDEKSRKTAGEAEEAGGIGGGSRRVNLHRRKKVGGGRKWEENAQAEEEEEPIFSSKSERKYCSKEKKKSFREKWPTWGKTAHKHFSRKERAQRKKKKKDKRGGCEYSVQTRESV